MLKFLCTRWRFRLAASLLVISTVPCQALAQSPEQSSSQPKGDSIAFIGDSISTGGGAHPALAFDMKKLEQVFADQVDLKPDPRYFEIVTAAWGVPATEAPSPKRLPLAPREYSHPLNWVFEKALHYVSHRYLDAERYSWTYLLARREAIAGDKILIAAKDGERSVHALRQVDRLLDATAGEAPRHLFIFFTGNDLCAPAADFATEPEAFSEAIERAVRYYVRNAKARDQGISHIWLLDPLGILQIVTSPAILNHKVQAFGREMSCRDLQAGRFPNEQRPLLDPEAKPSDHLLRFFSAGPKAYCPSLFAIHEAPVDLQIRLGGLLANYRSGLAKLAEKLKDLHPLFRVHHVKATADVAFQGEDMAHDCFHLSLNGQLKIAKTVHNAMRAEGAPLSP